MQMITQLGYSFTIAFFVEVYLIRSTIIVGCYKLVNISRKKSHIFFDMTDSMQPR